MRPAHQITGKHHEHSREGGYIEKEYAHQEYPKHVTVKVDGQTQNVIVESAEDEARLLEAAKVSATKTPIAEKKTPRHRVRSGG